MIDAPKSSCPIRPLFHAESLTLADLPGKASSTLPEDFQVQKMASGGNAEAIYFWDGTAFVDDEFTPVVSPITGTIRFVNPSSTDISFTW